VWRLLSGGGVRDGIRAAVTRIGVQQSGPQPTPAQPTQAGLALTPPHASPFNNLKKWSNRSYNKPISNDGRAEASSRLGAHSVDFFYF
jgi:hypothetical protein